MPENTEIMELQRRLHDHHLNSEALRNLIADFEQRIQIALESLDKVRTEHLAVTGNCEAANAISLARVVLRGKTIAPGVQFAGPHAPMKVIEPHESIRGSWWCECVEAGNTWYCFTTDYILRNLQEPECAES